MVLNECIIRCIIVRMVILKPKLDDWLRMHNILTGVYIFTIYFPEPDN